MSKERYIKVKVRKFNMSEHFSIGEYVEWDNIVYKFLGYEKVGWFKVKYILRTVIHPLAYAFHD